MSTQATTLPATVKIDAAKMHRLRLRAGYFLFGALVVALAAFGFDYYLLDSSHRPFSPKHHLLRPSGPVGLWLGVFGVALFLVIYLYALRKRWLWLRTKGNTKHWLDFHVLLGLSAPFIIVFHSSFKFGGLAGLAFWMMTAVAISGVIGRYVYAQIPRSLNTAELSLAEAGDEQAKLTAELSAQKLFSACELAPLFRLPSPERVRSEPLPLVLASMIFLDFLRVFQAARLRWRRLTFWGRLGTLGGILSSGNTEVERVISMARRQAGFSKRILFLSRTHQVFHYWHVIHRPFSYSFALLALIHISVVLLFGIR
jgi:hypothetical protein